MDEALARAIECTLVTRGRTTGEPREVVIWFAAVGSTVYLLSGGGESAHWVRNVRADPAVEVVVGGARYPGRARLVTRTSLPTPRHATRSPRSTARPG